MPVRTTEAIAGLSVVDFGLRLAQFGGIAAFFGPLIGITGIAGSVMAALLPGEPAPGPSGAERSQHKVLP